MVINVTISLVTVISVTTDLVAVPRSDRSLSRDEQWCDGVVMALLTSS